MEIGKIYTVEIENKILEEKSYIRIDKMGKHFSVTHAIVNFHLDTLIEYRDFLSRVIKDNLPKEEKGD